MGQKHKGVRDIFVNIKGIQDILINSRDMGIYNAFWIWEYLPFFF